jgi:hypothetical protein
MGGGDELTPIARNEADGTVDSTHPDGGSTVARGLVVRSRAGPRRYTVDR